MEKLYKLKTRLCEELCAFAERDISSSNLEMIDKLAHATKNIGKVIEMCEDEEYSNRGMSNDGSYARGRGRYAKRDAMGRYARDGEMSNRGSYDYSRDEETIHEMRRIAETLPSNERGKMERLIMRMEQM